MRVNDNERPKIEQRPIGPHDELSYEGEGIELRNEDLRLEAESLYSVVRPYDEGILD